MIQVNNQKPTNLTAFYQPVIANDYDPIKHIMQVMVDPIIQNKLNPNQPLIIKDDQNTDFTDPQNFINLILQCSNDNINPDAETKLKELLGQTLINFDQKTTLSIQEVFSIQSALKEHMPLPNSQIIYTPNTDVIPASKNFLAKQISYDNYFASLAFYARPITLGFYFATEQAFNDFKAWLQQQIATLQSALPASTNQIFQDFAKIKLDGLTESLLLRNNDNDNNEKNSFARCIVAYLMQYTKQASCDVFGVLPFYFAELINPKSIVFVNVEKHAHATSKQIADEWDIINQSIMNKPQIINLNKLHKLTAIHRQLKRAKSLIQSHATKSSQQCNKAAFIPFQKTNITPFDLFKRLQVIMQKMMQVNRSDNTFKTIKTTYQKPNRRDPDDFNKSGKTVSVKYYPDIHLYIDTSGSISEENYQDAVQMCMTIAKKLNINLYFNSFSHILSQSTKLETKDKTLKQIYLQFQKTPKVTGGTNYEQIWDYINMSKKRQQELSLIMTDFEWCAPNHYAKHPNNLYYAPISVNSAYWNDLTKEATIFCKTMQHIDLNIRKKLLF